MSARAAQDLGATITTHHLVINRNHILVGGIKPHYYCLPVAKRETHRLALRAAATSGDARFFLGTDSAPHTDALKEHACGCAGCFTATNTLSILAEVFEQEGALDRLEGFTSLARPRLLRPARQRRHDHPDQGRPRRLPRQDRHRRWPGHRLRPRLLRCTGEVDARHESPMIPLPRQGRDGPPDRADAAGNQGGAFQRATNPSSSPPACPRRPISTAAS